MDTKDSVVSRAIEVALNMLDTSTLKNFITKLLKEENVDALKNGQKTLDDVAVSVSVFIIKIRTSGR